MNDKQRLLIMVGTGSFLVLLITIFGLGYGSHSWNDTSKVDTSSERYDRENPKGGFDPNNFRSWIYKTNEEEGIKRKEYGIPLLFKKVDKTNWLGIIACFNIAFCLTGFFLFKDK